MNSTYQAGLTNLPQLIKLGNVGALGLILTLFIQPVLQHKQESAADLRLYSKIVQEQMTAHMFALCILLGSCAPNALCNNQIQGEVTGCPHIRPPRTSHITRNEGTKVFVCSCMAVAADNKTVYEDTKSDITSADNLPCNLLHDA